MFERFRGQTGAALAVPGCIRTGRLVRIGYRIFDNKVERASRESSLGL
jgi:hypothetical protein